MRYSEFVNLNTEILAIDVDTVYSHKVWYEIELSKMVPGGIPYPMLSDSGGKIGRLYDVYDEQKGRTLRGTFIIDHNGYVQSATPSKPLLTLAGHMYQAWKPKLTPELHQ